MPKFASQVDFMQAVEKNYFYLLRLRWGFTLLLLAGLVGCGNFGNTNLPMGANVTPIEKINPQQDNTSVYIQGKVEKLLPLVKQRAYQIKDSTGKIWVVTNQTNLKVGDRVVIKGTVRYKNIPLAGKDYGEVYIEEQ
ncbi:MAG: hypothetical protein QNJ47_23915 [Nostocaceae cyanobacterium]|nr:hypothetical protein [Nostocaceae cyanobacterium]